MLAVLTTYFNPENWKSRKTNYLKFREGLSNVDLFTVELSFTNDFFIEDSIKYSGYEYNKMWQKERLLNECLNTLPEKYTKIAWIDADIIFPDNFLSEKINEHLDKYDVIQLFSSVRMQGIDGKIEDEFNSFMKCYLETGKYELEGGKIGIAWAANRSVLTKFHDWNIIGGGDASMAYSWLGIKDNPFINRMNDEFKSFWMENQYEKANVGYIDQKCTHLYHGSQENRRYESRDKILTDFKFDPRKDIKIENGLWKWNTKKFHMHKLVSNYFLERQEDDCEDIRNRVK